MNGITWIHVAGGMIALVSGAVAVAVQKGSGRHASAGAHIARTADILERSFSVLEETEKRELRRYAGYASNSP